jgi:hypothetical protein
MDLIYERDDALSPDICRSVIDLFEASDSKRPGKVTNHDSSEEVDLSLKRTIDLHIDPHDENWKMIQDKISESLIKSFTEYRSKFLEIYKTHANDFARDFIMSKFHVYGYQVHKSEPGGFFDWHSDAHENRMFTVIFYMNTLNSSDEGNTILYVDGKLKHIIPKTGKIAIFPATWNYVHKGDTVKNSNKYIVTTFLHG